MAKTVLEAVQHVARLTHKCSWCGMRVEVGETYVRYVVMGDGGIVVVKLHEECYDAIADGASEYGYFEWSAGDHERGKWC